MEKIKIRVGICLILPLHLLKKHIQRSWQKGKILATPFKAPTFDKYFATFYDLDENLIQVIGDK